MTVLTARTLITDIGTVAYPAITVDSAGTIVDISSDPAIVSDRILTSTFLDLHTHGAAGHDVMSATPAELQNIGHFFARHGVSHYLPTTVTASVDETLRSLASLADAVEATPDPASAIPIGIHLEGPFLSHSKRGVHSAALLQKPSIELFDRFQQAARGHIRLVTLAPEIDGALDLIRHAVAANVRVSLGHSNATAAETSAAIAAGAVSATHTFNAMHPIDHREPGIAAVVLDTPNLYADLICDGIHVDPLLVRLWLRLKADRALLITDSISATGMPDGSYTLAGSSVTLANGRCTLTDHPETLAGSVLTLDRAVENLQAFTGCSLATAARAANSQPAAMLGITHLFADPGPGQPANFNQFTPEGKFEATYRHGRLV